jgi:hypothetical protein
MIIDESIDANKFSAYQLANNEIDEAKLNLTTSTTEGPVRFVRVVNQTNPAADVVLVACGIYSHAVTYSATWQAESFTVMLNQSKTGDPVFTVGTEYTVTMTVDGQDLQTNHGDIGTPRISNKQDASFDVDFDHRGISGVITFDWTVIGRRAF